MKPLPLSHSNLDRFVTCPKQFYHVKVVKDVPDPPGDAAMWGDYVHLEFEKYLKEPTTYVLPANVGMYQQYLDKLAAMPGELLVEQELAVNTTLAKCGFFDSDVFLRGYADFIAIKDTRASIIDHKTGKQKPNSRQMKLMALLVFLIYKQVQKIRVAFAWLKTGKYDSDEFTRADIPKLWSEFVPDIKQYKQAFAQDVWQPRQSGLCHGWCPVKTCEFWKPKRLGRK